MLGLGWFAARQASDALQQGRLEEVERLLGQAALQNHPRHQEIKEKLVHALAQQGERHRHQANVQAAWNDLRRAEQWRPDAEAVQYLRRNLTRQGLHEARMLLEQGKPARAVEIAGLVHERGGRLSEAAVLEDAARDWLLAARHADRGDFAQARGRVQKVQSAIGPVTGLRKFDEELEKRAHLFRTLLADLPSAAKSGKWPEMLERCEKILALAPEHVEARRLRAQAWKAMEPPTVVGHPVTLKPAAPASGEDTHNRWLLWIDGVGGYLVCVQNRVTLGQATADTTADVAVFADISRHHATLTRDAEGYLLESPRAMEVNGRPLQRALLQSGDRVTLGSSCQFQFQQPVPISASARLDFASGHRLRLAVDAVLLMADTLVLGPGPDVHVVVPDLAQNVVLYRQKNGIGVRATGQVTINGEPRADRGTISPGTTVAGDDFSFAVEAVGRGT